MGRVPLFFLVAWLLGTVALLWTAAAWAEPLPVVVRQTPALPASTLERLRNQLNDSS